MSLFEDTNPRALKELLAEIHNRTTVLPDFQRDFVWEPGATQELIVSIASNYPAGSILRVRDARRAFAAREFEGAPPLAGAKHTFLVLDGQQRLTSLYQALELGGEPAAAELAAKLGSRAETARELAYRLYTIAERKKRAAEALSYNALVQSWPEISRLARASATPAGAAQAALL